MFNMSDELLEFQATEKSNTVPFEDTSLDAEALNPNNFYQHYFANLFKILCSLHQN